MPAVNLPIVPPIMSLPSDQEASGRTLGDEEIALVSEAIRSGTLTSTKGKFVKQLETEFAKLLGSEYAHACSSGSSAIHIAVAALKPEPGDEFITTSVTDMGALTPILFQGAIPVFADVDPITLNVTPASIEARISERTKGIIVTHLFGNPCEMAGIMALAEKHGIPVIEDCAQAFLATIDGKNVGAIGDIGCFSFQQGKHITTGEGGIAVTNDEALQRELFLFINKAWGYGDSQPDHYYSALNYRLTELQGAVAVAQMAKLEGIVEARQATAARMTGRIAGLPGVSAPRTTPGGTHTYWKYCLNVDTSVHENGTVRLAGFLKDRGIMSAPRYIQKPAFHCQVFSEQKTLGNSRFPFDLARPEAVDYSRELFAGTYQGLERVLVLPWNEKYTDEHVDYIADAVIKGVEQL